MDIPEFKWANLEAGARLALPLGTSSGKVVLPQGIVITQELLLLLQAAEDNPEQQLEYLPTDSCISLASTSHPNAEDPVQCFWTKRLATLPASVILNSTACASLLEAKVEQQMAEERDSYQLLRHEIRPVMPGSRSFSDRREMRRAYKTCVRELKDIYVEIGQGEIPNIKRAYSIADNLIGGFLKDRNLMLSLCGAGIDHTDYLYSHAIDIAMICVDVSSLLYDLPLVRNICVGGMLADVGMEFISAEVRTKKGALSPSELQDIRLHPVYAMNALARMGGVPWEAFVMAFQAHERFNGSGYPRMRKGRQIHDFAQVYAIADIFSAMIRSKSYKEGHKPYSAMEHLIKMTKAGFLHSDLVKTFLNAGGLFPVGSYVKLNQGSIARVVGAPSKDISKPVVMIITDDLGRGIPEEDYALRDLENHRGVSIVSTVEAGELDVHEFTGF
jgi:HD-GYP domain-containing protein (c-di-GMP phosphodiesterase class II)